MKYYIIKSELPLADMLEHIVGYEENTDSEYLYRYKPSINSPQHKAKQAESLEDMYEQVANELAPYVDSCIEYVEGEDLDYLVSWKLTGGVDVTISLDALEVFWGILQEERMAVMEYAVTIAVGESVIQKTFDSVRPEINVKDLYVAAATAYGLRMGVTNSTLSYLESSLPAYIRAASSIYEGGQYGSAVSN